ncbi:hypothetical protein A6A04_05050 [Paramagnetospirillum marisnigri]|uniref:Uncharacterized protein n=1 Tax=Paramagnetospirillum marisnigri TaxID=1285242 RepID=A0A178MJ94_9PROT|nr:hypothetical protein A6A04_05050 [Paramagnetospirillum marisnigri]
MRLVGLAIVLGGLALGGAALMVDADASIQALMGIIALGGLVIALGGGAVMAVGAFLGRGKPPPTPPALSPEQQQLRDSREFLEASSKD